LFKEIETMLKKAFMFGLALALLLPVLVSAQEVRPTTAELGPFPVDQIRASQEQDFAKYSRVTTTSYGFLKLAGNARSAGMGDAYVAVGNDLSAVFYNPAGITQIERYALTASYLKWIVGSQMGTFALGAKTNLATFAVNFAYFKTDQFEETTSSQPGGTGRMVSGGDIAAGLTVAKQVTDKLSVGGNIRYVKEDLDLASYGSGRGLRHAVLHRLQEHAVGHVAAQPGRQQRRDRPAGALSDDVQHLGCSRSLRQPGRSAFGDFGRGTDVLHRLD
jgi:hypothetical protein